MGDLSNWQRRYAYRKWIDGTAYHLDSAVIEFWLREVGKFEFKSGREFVDGPLVADPDDRDYKVVFGSYDFLRRKFTLEYCGPNRR